jgi:acetyl esterase/lipase
MTKDVVKNPVCRVRGCSFCVSLTKIRVKKLLSIANLLFLATFAEAEPPVISTGKTTIYDVAYGSHPLQKMDIYLPAGRHAETTKVLVLIHGGAWSNGDKTDFNQYVSALQRRLPDYAIFNLNYRLVERGAHLFPSQENDIKAAIEFIYANRKEYKISDKFAYMGASAGAHLALLLAYKHVAPVEPKVVISFFGPTELKTLYHTSPVAGVLLSQVTGTAPGIKDSIYRSSSPAEFVSRYSPPTLLLHGGRDPLVPPAQSELLRTKLKEAGVANDYVFYPLERHGWTGQSLSDSFDKVARFLNSHM